MGAELTNISRELLLRFLTDLSRSADAAEWGNSFRNSLMQFFPEADRVALHFDRGLTSFDSDAGLPHLATVAIFANGDRTGHRMVLENVPSSRVEHVLEACARAGLAIGQYHIPLTLEIVDDKNDYLGAIMLWRFRDRVAFPTCYRDRLNQFRGLFGYLLAAAIGRFQVTHALYLHAHRWTANLARQGLTLREREVVMYRFIGKSIAETAELLGISPHTVRGHLKAIRSRVGNENFGKARLSSEAIRVVGAR